MSGEGAGASATGSAAFAGATAGAGRSCVLFDLGRARYVQFSGTGLLQSMAMGAVGGLGEARGVRAAGSKARWLGRGRHDGAMGLDAGLRAVLSLLLSLAADWRGPRGGMGREAFGMGVG